MVHLLVAALLACLLVPDVGHAYRARLRDFRCITKGVKPEGRNFYVFHRNKKKLAKAVEMSKTGELGDGYPVGTILQLFPIEAMVKRGRGFNPDGNGWEFFQLKVEEREGKKPKTTILQRGGAEVTNFLGSCQGCHAGVAPNHDLVCEFVIGAEGLRLTDEQIADAQAEDPRCAK
jgi:hypothetical protein